MPYIIATRQYVGKFIFTLLPLYPRVGGWGGGVPYTIREHAGCVLRAVLNVLEKLSQYFNRKMKGRNFVQNNKLGLQRGEEFLDQMSNYRFSLCLCSLYSIDQCHALFG
jgi:hypothetical protein